MCNNLDISFYYCLSDDLHLGMYVQKEITFTSLAKLLQFMKRM